MDLVSSIAMGAGMAWASGMRLYAVLFIAGLMGKLGYIALPDGLQILTHPLVMGAAGLMFAVEFFADKIPALDSVWDAIHTFIRIPAGALLAAMSLGGHDPAWMLAAAILGGSLAAGTHFTKAGGRAVINTSPEPFSNVTASLGEEALVAGGLLTAFFHPVVFLVLLALFVLGMAWVLPKLWRFIRRMLGRPDGHGTDAAAG
ncbi:MAG: DUF4126 domain-containing protein [Betaproteobacteria bacterium]|nr:DUF4126 domain-containing protein [Betaproteobacteria bacterium]